MLGAGILVLTNSQRDTSEGTGALDRGGSGVRGQGTPGRAGGGGSGSLGGGHGGQRSRGGTPKRDRDGGRSAIVSAAGRGGVQPTVYRGYDFTQASRDVDLLCTPEMLPAVAERALE